MDIVLFLSFAIASFLLWFVLGLVGGVLYSWSKGLAWILCILLIAIIAGVATLSLTNLPGELSPFLEKTLGSLLGSLIFWPAFRIGRKKIYAELGGKNAR